MSKKLKRPFWHWLILVLGILILSVLAGYLYIAWLLPLPESLDLQPRRHVSTKIYDRNGQLLYEVLSRGEGRKTYLRLDEMPLLFQKAIIASEDSDFYSHAGVDPGAIARALFYNYLEQKVTSGASTITQQLVRNLLGTNRERTLQEKLLETVYAIRLSHAYSKEKVLEEYLNTVYFGNLSYGVAEAARNYFGKNLSDLDLAEISILAGLPKAPSAYNPLVNPEKAQKRQQYVLGRLVAQGDITAAQAEEAAARVLHFKSGKTAIEAPHFVHHVLAQLEDQYGHDFVYGGISVRTTLDLNLQQEAQKIVNRQLDLLKQKNVGNAALLAATVPDGQVLVWLGSRDYFDDSIEGQVDIIGAARQPGSALKPFLYLLALENGDTLATLIEDLPIKVKTEGGVYSPLNYDLDFHGPVRLREALANSFNIPAVKTQEKLGTSRFLNFLRRLGLDTLDQDPEYYGLALTLGGGEIRLADLANAYLTLADYGRKKDFSTILEITDASGSTIYKWTPPVSSRVLGSNGEQNAWLITDSLSDPNARLKSFGEGNVLELSVPAAAKTGTTRNFRDNWTFGFTPQLLTAVWVGNSDASPMENISGIDGAGPIWHDFMTLAHEKLPAGGLYFGGSYSNSDPTSASVSTPPAGDANYGSPVSSTGDIRKSKESKENLTFLTLTSTDSNPLPPPPRLIGQQICAVSGLAESENCQESLQEWFIDGTEPQQKDYFWQKYSCGTGNSGTGSVRYLIDYPFVYQNWAKERGFLPPADCLALPPENLPSTTTDLPPLRIVSPLGGDSFQINANLPLESQKVPLKIVVYPGGFSDQSNPPSQIELIINGKVIKSQLLSGFAAPLEIKEFWIPERGQQRLEVRIMAEDRAELATDSVQFRVE